MSVVYHMQTPTVLPEGAVYNQLVGEPMTGKFHRDALLYGLKQRVTDEEWAVVVDRSPRRDLVGASSDAVFLCLKKSVTDPDSDPRNDHLMGSLPSKQRHRRCYMLIGGEKPALIADNDPACRNGTHASYMRSVAETMWRSQYGQGEIREPWPLVTVSPTGYFTLNNGNVFVLITVRREPVVACGEKRTECTVQRSVDVYVFVWDDTEPQFYANNTG